MVKYNYMKITRNSVIFSILLIIGDIAAVLGAYSLAYILRVKLSDTPIVDYVPAIPYFLSLLALVPFILTFFVIIGTYASNGRSKRSLQFTRLLLGAVGAMLFLITYDYFYIEPLFPAKLVPLYGLLFSILLLFSIRGGLYSLRWLWWRRDHHLQSVMLIGENKTARLLVNEISQKNSGYTLHSVIGDQRHSVTTHNNFTDAIKKVRPAIIVQIATVAHPTVNQETLRYALENYIEFKFIPSDFDELPDKLDFELFMESVPVLNVQPTALIGWGRVYKRVFELVICSLALIILSPLLLLIVIINYLVIGNVIFGQNRLTRGNQLFTLYKFQTIKKDYSGLSPEESFKRMGKSELIQQYRKNGDFLKNDPRYGRWAHLLRKTSLDELPQLWNVVKGDISLIGPRALVPEELDSYDKKHLILNVRSGITGLAQISGRRDLPWDQRRKLDIYYVQNWSFKLDIQIIFKTAWQVLTGRGAQ